MWLKFIIKKKREKKGRKNIIFEKYNTAFHVHFLVRNFVGS